MSVFTVCDRGYAVVSAYPLVSKGKTILKEVNTTNIVQRCKTAGTQEPSRTREFGADYRVSCHGVRARGYARAVAYPRVCVTG